MSEPIEKEWYKSKTLGFNVLMGVVGIAAILASPEGGLPPEMQKVWGSVTLIGNAVLRFLTNSALTK